MKALITGASSGLGRNMAIVLSKMGYDIIAVARREDRLFKLKDELQTDVKIVCLGLSEKENCFKLYELVSKEYIDIVVNNAGFGIFGKFSKTDLDRELELIKVNIRSVHILTKLFLNDFRRKNRGYIMNVASSAGFMPGPLMSVYYASKAYVLNLTQAISEELRREKSGVHICSLCPGPVKTEFDSVANVSFGIGTLDAYTVSEYAIRQMLRKKTVIIPGFKVKAGVFLSRFVSRKFLLKIVYRLQNSKESL
ncbi:MAG: SDR family oxidoreductase [Oscillospiraceae bacterium]